MSVTVFNTPSSSSLNDDLAIVQNGSTATTNITSGQYVCWNGVLKQALSNISSGDTFGSTNLGDPTNGVLNDLNSNIIGKLDSVTITTGTFTCYPTSSTVTIENNYSGTLPTVGFVFFTPYQFASDFGLLSFFWEGGKLKCKGQATYGATKVRWFKFTPAS